MKEGGIIKPPEVTLRSTEYACLEEVARLNGLQLKLEHSTFHHMTPDTPLKWNEGKCITQEIRSFVMYRSGYLDLICELKYLLEVLIHTVFYHYRIYPQGSFQKHRRFGIIVRCQEKPEVIRYVQQITEVLYLLLKDKVLNACSIVLTRKDSGETLATYNLQVERHLYMTTISHFDITSLRDEFAKALMKFETRAHAPEEPCEFNVYFYTRAKLNGAMVKGVYPRETSSSVAQLCAPPVLKLEETLKFPGRPRDYIHSIILAMGKTKEELNIDVPLVQFYRKL